jgi:hypothetical protein
VTPPVGQAAASARQVPILKALTLAIAGFSLAGCDGDAQALREAQQALLRGSPQAGAFQLRTLAATGYAPAQFQYGMLLLQGQITPDRLEQGGRWLTLAADKDNVGAQYYLAQLQLMGNLPTASVDTGLQRLAALADRGLIPAQQLLGQLYERGERITADPAKALAWYRRAAEAGHRPAIERLITAHENGELGLQPDPERAEQWRNRLDIDPFSRSENTSEPR